MKGSRYISAVVACWLLGLTVLPGCDNTISPLTDDAEKVFAIHGFLDSDSDTQTVRINALTATVLAENPSLHEISIQSVDVQTSEVVTWSDSPVELFDGSIAHLFSGVFTPLFDHTYELQVWRRGEPAAKATTTIPGRPSFFASEPVGDTLQFSQVIFIEGLDAPPLHIAMRYEVSRPNENAITTVFIQYDQDGRLKVNGWEFDAYLKRDQQVVLRDIGWPTDGPAIELRSVGAFVSVQSPEWERIDNPVNLQNAHGFFGSLGRFELQWTLDSSAVGVIGFVDKQTPR